LKTEFEVKILEIDHDEMIEKLESLGATKKSEGLQERFVYDVKPKNPNRWIRLRKNATKTTLTIKNLQEKSIDGMKELEIEVSDFEETNAILETLGFKNRGFQQNRRVQYILDDVEIDLDKWPMIPEYMEIEGKDTESVYHTLEKLGIDKNRVTTLDVESIYRHYGHHFEHLSNLSFEMEEK